MSNNDSKTNGRSREYVNRLWERVRDCIDRSYLTGERYPNGGRATVPHDDPRSGLRDWVRNQSMLDKMDELHARETAHERRHRRGAPAGFRYPISASQAARVVLLHQVGNGASLEAMPPASYMLQVRDTAGEANVVGYLARAELLKADEGKLVAALEELDYAQAVRS